MLDDCHYYLSFLMNVISVGLLVKLGFKFIIKDNFYDIIMNDTVIMCGQLKYGIYIISRPVSIMYTTSKCPSRLPLRDRCNLVTPGSGSLP